MKIMATRLFPIILACGMVLVPVHAARDKIELRHVVLDLPGPPARVLPADLDGDGRQDLVVIVAYTEIEQVSEDRVEEMIQITRVIPTLFDRREARVYLATADGDYRQAGPPLELPVSVLHLEVGPPGVGLIALTDAGLSAARFRDGVLSFEPLVEQPPIMARTRTFFTTLELVNDLDGDGIGDVWIPTAEGYAIYLGDGRGIASEPSSFLPAPRARQAGRERRSTIRLPLPSVEYVDGDELPDLVFRDVARGRGSIDVYIGLGGGRFEPLRKTANDCHDRLSDLRVGATAPGNYPWPSNVMAFRDLDGDRLAETVIRIEQSRGDSWRKELKDAKKPIHDYRFHRLNEDRSVVADPYFQAQLVGHTMDGELDDGDGQDSPFHLEQFIDLDADGREDLVTITLQFSMFQVLKVLTTKKVGIGINFHIYAQQPDGSFREVPDLDLSEKLKLDLNNLEIGRFAQFAGDFDGDGRQDFVHLGRGESVTVHRGQAGCRYPKKPDLVVQLGEELPSLDLVRVEDLDGDGRADIRITRPLSSNDPDLTAPARLDLYLSGAGR